MEMKIASAAAFPDITLSRVGGGSLALGKADSGRWQMVVVYRGKHCPICKRYLGQLEAAKSAFAAADVDVVAVSADPEDRASSFAADIGLTVPVGYGLTVEQMQKLGLYVSEPRSPQETDRPFAEPGIFVVNADGRVHVTDISNAPFARPDLGELAKGLKFIRDKDYPIRGTLAA